MSNKCEWCGLTTRDGGNHKCQSECIAALRRVNAQLLKQVGQASSCRGCGTTIYWIVHQNGKRAPYNAAGESHFADCPAAPQFRVEQTREVRR